MRIPRSSDYNFAVEHPDLIHEWDYDKNQLGPEQYTSGSGIKVWWKCVRAHEWMASLSKRALGRKCPYCSNKAVSESNNLLVRYPSLAKQWHPTKNGDLKPTDVLGRSGKKVWWQCSKNHEWEAAISNRTGGRGCPYCSGKIPSVENNVLLAPYIKEWNYSRNPLPPESYTLQSNSSVWWQCSKNHEWEAIIYNRAKGKGCPNCANTHTNLEKFVESKLNIDKFNKSVLINANYKPDFKLSDELYLNVDGLYWHSVENKERDYHFKMREAYECEGKRIFQFYDDEIYQKWSIVESIINNSLGKTSNKIGARDCSLSKLDGSTASDFLNSNHLMGSYKTARHFGLMVDSNLVSLMSVRMVQGSLEIARFGSLKNTQVIGGFGKLLSFVIREFKPREVISFCDLRYATGKSYEKLGFKRIGVIPSWCWTDFVSRYNRLSCRAGNGKSEAENAKEKHWYKLYDAGQAKYILTL